MRRADLLALAGILAGAAAAGAEPPALGSGAVEIGAAGSVVTTEGATRATLAIRSGTFLGAGPGLVGLEGEVGYGRIRELDRLDLVANLTWTLTNERSALYPFLGATVGLRQEWLGSFRNAMTPVGAVLGLRILASPRVGARVEYRVARFLDDPAPDFTEHQVLFGLSILLRNGSG